ncbi:MAG: hypothetical protein HKO77_00860, partial [Gemmatimonadetes bacterium]|nr:hypothetical protein [Gemmatimonadota bacterium]
FYVRALVTLTAYADDGREVSLGVGLARVTDSRFEAGATRRDGILQVTGRIPLLERR